MSSTSFVSFQWTHYSPSLQTAISLSPLVENFSLNFATFFRFLLYVPTVALSMEFSKWVEVKNLSKIRTTSFRTPSIIFWTTRSPRFPSTCSVSFLQYMLVSYTYPESASLLVQSLTPLLIGLRGMYCFNENLPLNFVIDSSIDWYSMYCLI